MKKLTDDEKKNLLDYKKIFWVSDQELYEFANGLII